MTASPSSPTTIFSRVLASRLDEIEAVTEALTEWLHDRGAAPRTTSSIALMLDELITNVVTHGYGGDGSGTIRLQAQIDGPFARIQLTDHAFAFDPLQAPEPDTSLGLEERDIGGLGVHFVRKMADEIAYRRIETPAGPANELRFAKRLVPPPSGEHADG